MHSIRRLALSTCLALNVAFAASHSSTDEALLAELAQADGRTVDAHGNLIPAPLDRSAAAQKIGARTVSVPAGMRLIPADAAAGTPDFFAGIYEVTQAEYSAFLAANPAIPIPSGWTSRACPRGTENFPVTGIAQADALAYCSWITTQTGRTVSLPSVVQADSYSRGAARSATASPPRAVGADPRDVSASGCFDVRGNAAEWRIEQVNGGSDARTGFRLVAAIEPSMVDDKTVSALDGTVATTLTPATPTASSYIDITQQPTSQPVALGGNFTLAVAARMVIADSGRSALENQWELSYQWIKDDTPIVGATASSYSVSTMREADAGTYLVMIKNAYTGIVTYGGPAVVDVGLTGTAPRITRAPADFAVASGGTAAVSFDFETPHRHTLVWMLEESALPPLTAASPDVQTTASASSSTATWRNASRNSALTFTFRVITAYGSAEASTKVIVVNDGAAPTITRHPSSAAVARGGSVTLEASATGTPAPTYQWFRNGTAIPGASSSTLTLGNLQETDVGPYSVTASNVLGSTTSTSATVTISTASVPASTNSGGGGAPSVEFVLVTVLALAARRHRAARADRTEAAPHDVIEVATRKG